MQVAELNQVEQEAIKTVCEQPLEPVPEEVAEPVAVAAPEQVAEQVVDAYSVVNEQVAAPKPKRKVGRAKGYKPPKAIIEKVYQEERVLEELNHTKKQIDTLNHAEVSVKAEENVRAQEQGEQEEPKLTPFEVRINKCGTVRNLTPRCGRITTPTSMFLS